MSELSILSEHEVPNLEQGILTDILANQQQILNNQNILLKAERNRRIWGIVKMIFLVIIIIVPIFFIPMIMSLMMGEMMPGMNDLVGGNMGGFNLDAILGNSDVIESLLSGQ
jgi:hypothetical protein